MRLVVGIAALGLCLAAPEAPLAQETPPLGVGELVRVRADGSRPKVYRFISLSPESLLVRSMGREVELSLRTAQRLEVRRQRTRREQVARDAAVGTVVGTVLGAFVAYVPGEYCNLLGDCYPIKAEQSVWWLAAGGAAGAGIGALAGAKRSPTETWRDVPASRWRVGAVGRDRAAALAVSWRH
jgi:hypothetical protein